VISSLRKVNLLPGFGTSIVRRVPRQRKTQIITTGGGALIAERNRELIRSKAALVIYLSCSLPEINAGSVKAAVVRYGG
jgi:shikimate kinase